MLLVVVGAGVGGLFWMAGRGVFPLFVPLIPALVAIPAIGIFWWGQVRKWPPKDV